MLYLAVKAKLIIIIKLLQNQFTTAFGSFKRWFIIITNKCKNNIESLNRYKLCIENNNDEQQHK